MTNSFHFITITEAQRMAHIALCAQTFNAQFVTEYFTPSKYMCFSVEQLATGNIYRSRGTLDISDGQTLRTYLQRVADADEPLQDTTVPIINVRIN